VENALIDALKAAVGVQAAAFALAAVGLNLQFGYTGLLNFGHVAFMLAGAYGTAIVVDSGGSLWLGIAVGIAAAVALGLLFGVPTLRLRADYLAIVTITAGETLRLIVRAGDRDSLTHGVFGIQRFANELVDINPFTAGSHGIGRLSFSAYDLWVIVIGWTLVVVFTLLLRRMVTSPWGRVIKAIREDEDAVRSLGKNPFVYKLQSLCIGGVLGALAGALLAVNQQSVTPDYYLPALTFYVYTVVIMGGAATVLGPIVGSMIFWLLLAFSAGSLRVGIQDGWIPESLLQSNEVAAVRFMLVGLGLMALAIWRPQGIFGRREEVMLDAR
jgi:branched-chain amino acid transport system permease protein